MDRERNQSATEVRIVVRGFKIVTVAVFLLRLFIVGFAVWGIATGRGSVRGVASVGDGLVAVMLLAYSVELVVAISLLASPDPFATTKPAPQATAAGCQYDAQCKDNRICDKGTCVEPPAAAAAAQPQQAPPAAAPNP